MKREEAMYTIVGGSWQQDLQDLQCADEAEEMLSSPQQIPQVVLRPRV